MSRKLSTISQTFICPDSWYQTTAISKKRFVDSFWTQLCSCHRPVSRGAASFYELQNARWFDFTKIPPESYRLGYSVSAMRVDCDGDMNRFNRPGYENVNTRLNNRKSLQLPFRLQFISSEK